MEEIFSYVDYLKKIGIDGLKRKAPGRILDGVSDTEYFNFAGPFAKDILEKDNRHKKYAPNDFLFPLSLPKVALAMEFIDRLKGDIFYDKELWGFFKSVEEDQSLTQDEKNHLIINIKKSYIFKAIYQFSKPDNLTQPKSGNSNQPEKRLLILLDVAKIYLSGETRDPQAIYSELFKAYTESDKGAQQFFTSINVVKFSKTDKDKVIQALKVADKEEVWSRLPSQILIDYLLGKISEKSDQYRKSLHKILKIIDPKGFSPALQGLYDAIKDRLAKDYPKKSLKNILAKGKGYQRKRPLVDLPEVEIIDKNPEDDKSVVNYFVHAFSLFEEQWKDIKTLNLTYENNIEYENNKSVYENWCADLWELITAIEAKKYSIQVTSTDWLSEVKEAYQQNFPYGRLFDRFSTISLTESNSEKNSDFAITSTKFNFGAGID